MQAHTTLNLRTIVAIAFTAWLPLIVLVAAYLAL